MTDADRARSRVLAQIAATRDPAEKARILAASVTEPTADPTPLFTVDPTPVPLPVMSAKDRARMERAAVKAERDATARRAADEAGRKSKAVIAMVIDTCRAQYNVTTVFAPVTRNVPAIPAAGRLMKAMFQDDPTLTPDEVAAGIVTAIASSRQPVRVTRAWLTDRIGMGRRGPWRTVDLLDRATNRGLTRVGLGESKFAPTPDPAPAGTTTDDELARPDGWLTDDQEDDDEMADDDDTDDE